MTGIGPSLVSPAFDEKPWGGRRLARFGFDLPSTGMFGEALITASEARIASGPLAGLTIGEAAARDPVRMLGQDGLAATSGLPVFSLLIKLVDAERPLSIQVHPANELAPPGSLGKTEAWHVLEAKPGAVFYMGPLPGVGIDELAGAARAGRPLAGLLRAIPARPGMTVLMPAGTVHALGAGIVIYEIQQPSRVTYRLDDWRRPGDPGQPREMHIEPGLAALNPDLRPEPSMPAAESGPVQRLTACQFFALDRIELRAGELTTLPDSAGPQTFTCLRGEPQLNSAGGSLPLQSGETAVLFAAEGDLRIRAIEDCVMLAGSVPPASGEQRAHLQLS